jgi:hypothetical protein
MTSPKDKPTDTAAPQRNFTLTTEERVRAAAAGPPAFIRRLRAIEDLEEGIVRVLVERCELALAREPELAGRAAELEAFALERAPLRALERLNDLVARHNRWYPVEANLAMHPRTGAIIDRTGRPWEPMALRTMGELVAQAVGRLAS